MKKRIFITLIFSLLVTVLIAWFVIGFGMFRPLRKKMLDSRADIVATVASEVELATFPRKRVIEFEKKLHLEIKIRKRRPEPSLAKPVEKHLKLSAMAIRYSVGRDVRLR